MKFLNRREDPLKKVTIGRKPKPTVPGTADEFVERGQETPPPIHPEKEEMKRFTVDIPVSLHRRARIECLNRGISLADVIRECLEKKFPPK